MQAINPNLVEIKMMQRHKDCDISSMLFYTYYLAKFENENVKNVFNLKIDRDFIEKCFFCGCDSERSGKRISNYIIQKASFADFYRRIKEGFSGQNVTKNYIEQVMMYAFFALREGLSKYKLKHEEVLIYDEKLDKFEPLKLYDNPVEEKVVKMFLDPFFNLSDHDLALLIKQCDAISVMYQALKKWFIKKEEELLIYCTLYDNNVPVVPVDKKIKFKFCRKVDHSKDGCVTKSTAQQIQKNRTKKKLFDNKFDEFYQFVGLPIRKVADQPDKWLSGFKKIFRPYKKS